MMLTLFFPSLSITLRLLALVVAARDSLLSGRRHVWYGGQVIIGECCFAAGYFEHKLMDKLNQRDTYPCLSSALPLSPIPGCLAQQALNFFILSWKCYSIDANTLCMLRHGACGRNCIKNYYVSTVRVM